MYRYTKTEDMNKKLNKLIFTVLIFFIFAIADKIRKPEDIKQSEPTVNQVEGLQTSSQELKVLRVIDGDTIVLENAEKVRYIGVDSPEIGKGNECFAEEAKIKNEELVLGKVVRLVNDVSERD